MCTLALKDRALCFNEIGSYDYAIKDAEQLIDLHPTLCDGYNTMAEVLLSQLKIDEAKDILRNGMKTVEDKDLAAKFSKITCTDEQFDTLTDM